MVTQLLEVALNMSRSERTSTAGEQRINGIPGKTRTVEAAAQTGFVAVIVLEIERRHTGYEPGGRSHHIDGGLSTFEVVDIRCIVLCAACLSGNELGKFSSKGYLRWLGKMQEWYLVKHIGEPLTLLAPVEIDAPKGVLQRFGAQGYLGGKRLF